MDISENTLFELANTVGKANELRARAEDANRVISDMVFSLGWAMNHGIIPVDTAISRIMAPDVTVGDLHARLSAITDVLRSFENTMDNLVANELHGLVDAEADDG